MVEPESRPLRNLALAVATATRMDAASVLRGLTTDPGSFDLTARQVADLAHLDTPAPDDSRPRQPEQRRVLLVVDQAEQLFTQCESDEERLAFISALAAAADPADGSPPAALVILVVRADFEATLAGYPAFTAAVQRRYMLMAMTKPELRAAITEPARAAGAQVDDHLVGQLLEDAGPQTGDGRAIGQGMLPLLSHALDQAWRGRAEPALLTVADYARTGGITGAVAKSAEEAYQRLTKAQQVTARQVFLKLVTTTGDGTDAADRVTMAELAEGRQRRGEAADVQAVLDAFAEERLLTLGRDSVEITHEALLQAWPLLHS